MAVVRATFSVVVELPDDYTDDEVQDTLKSVGIYQIVNDELPLECMVVDGHLIQIDKLD